MKKNRVIELERIAQSLGAKHFRITYKEKLKTVSSNSFEAKAAIKAGKNGIDTKVNHSIDESQTTTINIEADMSFPGHEPIRPELHVVHK